METIVHTAQGNQSDNEYSTTMAYSVSLMHAIHLVFMSYVEVVLSSLGIVCNIIIVIIFCNPRAAKACGKSTRLYYASIGASDLLNILDMQFFISFLGYGVEYLTQGRFAPGFVEHGSAVTCKIFWYPYFVSEQVSGFVLVTLSFERLYAVYFPMQVKTVWSYKRVKWGIIALVFAVLLWNINIIVSITPRMTSASYVTCQPDPTNSVHVVLFWVTYGMVNYGLPTTLVIIINIFILAKMASASRRRSAMITGEQNNAESVKQRMATVSLVLLACIHAVIFLPATCLLTLEALVYIGAASVNPIVFAVIGEAAYIFFHITGVSKILNFVVYYKRVPYFRQNLLGACPKRSKSSEAM